jgi:hypothetical protein
MCPEINTCWDVGEFCIRLDTRAGISGEQLLGAVVLHNRLTGAVHHRFLVNDLPVLLEHMPLHQRQHMWLIHYGAPTNFLRIVRQYVTQIFGEPWMGRGGPVNWLARSPDLNPLNIWVWGPEDFGVFSADQWLRGIKQRVENVCQEIRVKPGIFDRVLTSVRRRAESCVGMHVNHIDRASAVEITRTSPISQEELVSGHMLTGTFPPI